MRTGFESYHNVAIITAAMCLAVYSTVLLVTNSCFHAGHADVVAQQPDRQTASDRCMEVVERHIAHDRVCSRLCPVAAPPARLLKSDQLNSCYCAAQAGGGALLVHRSVLACHASSPSSLQADLMLAAPLWCSSSALLSGAGCSTTRGKAAAGSRAHTANQQWK